MQNQLTTVSPIQIIAQPARRQVDPLLWLQFFSPEQALQDVINYVETLPGSRNERLTMNAYLSSLAGFFRHMGASVQHHSYENYTWNFDTMRMPTASAVQDYIASLSRRGLASGSIVRYMAAVRHFLRALETQEVIPQGGGDFVFILEAQRQFRLAINTRNPAPEKTSNRPALEQTGTRLNLIQVNTLFEYFADKMDNLASLRDLALLYVGITSGLRASELARITLNAIRQGDDCWEIHVRGKRNNIDPVGIDSTAYELIMQYVTAFNAAVPPALRNTPLPEFGEGPEVGLIAGDIPIFQPLDRYGNRLPEDVRAHTLTKGLSARAILKIVERRTEEALKFSITAHDMRRTCAYLMRNHGYEWDHIRAQLRHRSIGTTEKYVGQKQDLSRSLLSRRVQFSVPAVQS